MLAAALARVEPYAATGAVVVFAAVGSDGPAPPPAADVEYLVEQAGAIGVDVRAWLDLRAPPTD